MMRRLLLWTLLLAVLPVWGAGSALAAGPRPQPLERAHAHNDYEHDRPLLDALLAAGVDHVNTDDLTGLRDWLLHNDPQERRAA